MSDQRATTYETPAAEHTTIIHEETSRDGGGGAVWVFGFLLLIAVLAAVYFLSTRSDSEAVKDNAVAGAAQQVGDAAQKIGNAAETAADNVTNR
jgi:hypothetical protein